MSEIFNNSIGNNNDPNQAGKFSSSNFLEGSFSLENNEKIIYQLDLINTNNITLTISRKPEDIEKYNSLLSLSHLAQVALYWLAINYIDLSLVELEDCLIDYWDRYSDVENTLFELEQKEYIQKNEENWQLKEETRSFLLPQLSGRICEEIESSRPNWLDIFPLLQANTYEYIKQQQINNIIRPIINFLEAKLGKIQTINKLNSIIDIHREIPYQESFAVGNIINLLVHLNNYCIENQDFSEMSVWNADLTNVKLYNVKFSRSNLSDCSFLKRNLGNVLSVDVSPNNQYIATGDTEGYVKVFDVETGKEIYSLRRKNYWASVWVVRFDPSGKIIASAGDDHRITLWKFEDLDKDLPLGKDEEHNDSIRTIVFVDDNTLISGSGDHTVKYWDISKQRELLEQNQLEDVPPKPITKSFQQVHTNSVRSLAISKDKNYIISGGLDQRVVLWEKSKETSNYEWKKIHEYKEKFGKVRGVAFHPAFHPVYNSTFVIIYDDVIEIIKNFKLFRRIRLKKEINPKNNLQTWILCSAIDPTGKWLATGDEKGCIKLWKLDLIIEKNGEYRPKYEFKAHDGWIRSLAFIDEQRFVTGSMDCSIKTWNILLAQDSTTSVQSLRNIKGYSNWIWSLIYSRDDKYLISSHGDSNIRVWKNDKKFDSPIQILKGHSSITRTMTLTCDGEFLATGGSDCLIKLWDTKEIFSESLDIQSRDLKGHQSWVRCIRSHPKNPHVIASCGDDTTIRLWDIHNQQCYQILGNPEPKEYLENKKNVKRHTDPVRTLCFSEDGKYIASGGGDKKIIVWKLKENADSNQPQYEFFDCKEYIEKQSGNAEWVWSIAFISDEIVAVGGGSKEPAVFKVTENSVESNYNSEHNFFPFQYDSPSRILKYHPKTQYMASGGTDHKVEFWRIDKHYRSQKEQKGTIRAMAFSNDGKILATGGQDEHLYLWNVEDGHLLNKKLLVNSPYVNIKLDLVSGLPPEELESISKLISGESKGWGRVAKDNLA